MKTVMTTPILFLIIFVEGYIVLASELLAIRQSIPFVGDGTDTISIIIAAVLMPLAFGYYTGGQFKTEYIEVIRAKLFKNFLISFFFLAPGLTYVFISKFFLTLLEMGIDNRLMMTAIYSTVFLAIPVYLLGQTIPLITNFFSKENLPEVTGRILFFSTVGSFLGAVFSTLVLMSAIGVNYTSALVLGLLLMLIIILAEKRRSFGMIMLYLFFFVVFQYNTNTMLRLYNIVANNTYNTVMVLEQENGFRNMVLNNNNSSRYSDDGRKHLYVEFVEDQVLPEILGKEEPQDILVIGAGGFTFGIADTYNNYDFIDIDKDLQDLAEEHLLKQELTENKKFHAVPARGFLMQSEKKYQVIFLDVFQADTSLPEHLITQEFFKQISEALADNGVVFANFAVSPNYMSTYARTLDNTWRSVFPYSSRHVIEERYAVWNQNETVVDTVIYMARNYPDANTGAIYTDDLNRSFLDRPKKRYH